MFNVKRLQEILNDTTAILSKGESTIEYLRVMGIPEPLSGEGFFVPVSFWPRYVVDCEFLSVGVNDQLAKKHMQEFRKLVESFPEKALLTQGPSFRHLTQYVGSELNALRFIALGEMLELWSVVIPSDLSIPEDQCRALAALGWVCMSGYPHSALEEARRAVS